MGISKSHVMSIIRQKVRLKAETAMPSWGTDNGGVVSMVVSISDDSIADTASAIMDMVGVELDKMREDLKRGD